ncbi:MAG TPA: TetR/AcrR family transcriptional regulator [Acetobacteraceae bacterium]|nr:TetR/AcrR family transcriptional regulator [Acetobacteraceae bacterium]
MKTPLRILRAVVEAIDHARPPLTKRACARRDRIIANATTMIARFTLLGVTMSGIAAALGIGAGSIRRFFPDIFCIVADIIERDLRNISDALAAVPPDAENRPLLLAQAYWRVTRDNVGAFTEAHRITVRDRQFLPEDLREKLERSRLALGDIIAPGRGHKILAMLDTEEYEPQDLEALFPALPRQAAPQTAKPKPVTAPPQVMTATKRAIADMALPVLGPTAPAAIPTLRPTPPHRAPPPLPAMRADVRERLVSLAAIEAAAEAIAPARPPP